MAVLISRPFTVVLVPGLALASVALLPPAPTAAQSLTQEEALALAFPRADSVSRRTAYLDDGQLARAAELAGDEARPESAIVSYYVAWREGTTVGAAYFDAHRVRTLPEVLMVVVGLDARIRRVEVVRFSEPPEYRPPQAWLDLFVGGELDEALAHKRRIPNMTGATLTARAAALSARRVLALHAVIRPFSEEGP